MLYGRYFIGRYTAVADAIPSNVRVHETCAGDCFLYRRFLKNRPLMYMASDINPMFVSAGQGKGIHISRLDVRRDTLLDADYVLMLASLYQFIPEHKAVVDRLLASARECVIITEPVRNLATSAHPFVRFIGRCAVNPGTGPAPQRFDEKSMDDFIFEAYGGQVAKAALIAGGREKMYVIRARGLAASL